MSTVTRSRSESATPQRAPAPPGRWRRAGTVLAGVALAAAAVSLQAFGSAAADHDTPLTWTGGVGDEVVASRFSARVKTVRAAKALESKSFSDEKTRATTKGIFIIVEMGATSARKPLQLGTPVLLTESGHRYEATDKVDSSLTITELYIQPGWWGEGVTVFDLPPDELPGSRIVLAPSASFLVEPNGPEIEIDLGLDEAAAKRLVSTAKDVYTMAVKL
ncbi:hypothetical protein [Streptosporangium sp. 'caverna']|uniref:hypothetical protein n=1 Tax=Streptosporangium sp. 'caverna' TaxID=2202249 RepID=UPI000D7D3C4C|nr:hypothetical protein [Streptosporangium sp. 'caverna']AWS40376.1 hypothetical protein DKM19_02525 [Streptosporangium sp. 'caverna']